MGQGIVQTFAQNGFQVIVMDIDPQTLGRAKAQIKSNIEKLGKKKNWLKTKVLGCLQNLEYERELTALKEVDLVIEAVPEILPLKKKVISEVCSHLKAKAILASNTSSYSISGLASVSDRPEKFLGVHFMNPVPVMNLVELIQTPRTDPTVFIRVKDLMTALGKMTVVSQNFPGFIVNRVLMPMINEAIFALYEGVATREDIDTGMRLGTNHPMGPLELADLIGLDTCLAIMQRLHEGFADSKYRPCPLLCTYVETGWLGRKSGKGFYDYA